MTAIHTKSSRTPNSKYVLKNTFYKQLLNIFTVAKKRTLIHYPNVTFPTAFSQQKTHFFSHTKNKCCMHCISDWMTPLATGTEERDSENCYKGKKRRISVCGSQNNSVQTFWNVYFCIWTQPHTHVCCAVYHSLSSIWLTATLFFHTLQTTLPQTKKVVAIFSKSIFCQMEAPMPLKSRERLLTWRRKDN